MIKFLPGHYAGKVRTAIVLGLMILLAACGGEDKKSNQAPSPSAQSPAPVSPEIAPKPERAPVSQKTKDTYQWHCAQCHGVEGKGNGINAQFLTVPPRNHTKAEYIETRTDDQLFEAIKFGGYAVGRAPCMPAWGHTLDDETIRSMVRYIRELCQCEAL